MNNSFLLALATLVGTIIGGGVFALPYVVSRAGIIPSLFYFAVLGGVVLLLHLMFGEIALRTTEKHRLIGYANIYLGNWAKKLVTFSTIFGIVGALLAYIILAGNFLHILLGSFLPVSNFTFSILFWFVFSLFVLRGIQAIAKMELLINIALFLVIGIIFTFVAPHVEAANFISFDYFYVFLPYGVILFALLGLPAIPEIAALFKGRKEKSNLDNLIVWSSVICGGLYLLFVLFVVGVSGAATTEDALTGLIPFVGQHIVMLGAVFGLLAIAASFLVLGNYLKNSLRYDYKVPYVWAGAAATVLPISLFVLGLREFITVLGFVGALVGAIEGILVLLIFQKAKRKGDRKPEYSIGFSKILALPIIGILVLGAAAGIMAAL
jgi:tyrosine-specific transport protein